MYIYNRIPRSFIDSVCNDSRGSNKSLPVLIKTGLIVVDHGSRKKRRNCFASVGCFKSALTEEIGLPFIKTHLTFTFFFQSVIACF